MKWASSPWLYDKRKTIRDCFREGRTAAYCQHPREDCPYAGDIGQQRGEMRYRRTPAGAKIAHDKRAAWLDGWDRQMKLMKEEADNA